MKTKLIILIALASTGASFGAYAQLPADVLAQQVGLEGSVPRLFPSEQGAFKALEVATQLIESKIVQRGCKNTLYKFWVETIYDGSGKAVLSNPWSKVKLTVALGDPGINDDGTSANDGRWYTVTGGGWLGGMAITDVKGEGSFNIGSSIQELSTRWKATSYVTYQPNDFKGSVIKDYWRLAALQAIPDGFDNAGIPVSSVIDYGYQQVTKGHYVKAKYYQESWTWRDDGVNAGTWWRKTRVAPTGQECIIEVKLAGYGKSPTDNIEGFNEKGTVQVKTEVIGPYFKPKEARK